VSVTRNLRIFVFYAGSSKPPVLLNVQNLMVALGEKLITIEERIGSYIIIFNYLFLIRISNVRKRRLVLGL
jgi:hypothetical protein